MKPLFVPLKTEYFRAFEAGSKTTEYRLYGPRWNETTCIPGRAVTLSHGYSGERIPAVIVQLRKIQNTITDLYPTGVMLAAIDLQVRQRIRTKRSSAR